MMETHRWGDYEITQVLGKGGMGIVYKGRQVSLDRPVAIKVLPASLTNCQDFVDRFYREAKAVAKINCPQIIQVYGAGEFQGKHYFAMEFVEGEDIGQKLKKGTRFDLPKVIHVVREVARALAAAGEKSIIHRDIKPANIMMTSQGEIKVMDFGLAKITSDGSAELTQAGVVMGTINYLSPEQGQGKVCDQRTDLYSLGVVMYELLTMQVPFQGENPSAIIYQHIHATPPPPSKLNPEVPKEIEAIVAKLLQKDPNNRYFSARDLVRDLDAVESGAPPKTALMDVKTLTYTKPGGSRLKVVLVVAVVVLVALGIGGWLAYPALIKPALDKFLGRTPPPVVTAPVVETPPVDNGAQDGERRRNDELQKKIDTELATIEAGLKTNNIEDLQRLNEHLGVLAGENPGNTRIPVLAGAITAKIEKIRGRDQLRGMVETLLAAQAFDDAEKAAQQLLQNDPEDPIAKTIYARVLKEKEAFASVREGQDKIVRRLTEAQTLLENNAFELALVKYKEVLLQDPGNLAAQAGARLCEEKLAARPETPATPGTTAGGLSGKEQIAYMQCFTFFNKADEAFQQGMYEASLTNADKALAVEGIDNVAEAVDLKKKAVKLKADIENILEEKAREDKRRERVRELVAAVDERARAGNERGAIDALNELGELDPAGRDRYDGRRAELLGLLDEKVSREILAKFDYFLNQGDLAGLLSLADPEAIAFRTQATDDFKAFFAAFTGIRSVMTADRCDLAPQRDTCSLKGTWEIAFTRAEEGVTTQVAYDAEFRLVKRNGQWNIAGVVTKRKEP
ncbi:MAG: protein kinase [Planctomycetota bacterium]